MLPRARLAIVWLDREFSALQRDAVKTLLHRLPSCTAPDVNRDVHSWPSPSRGVLHRGLLVCPLVAPSGNECWPCQEPFWIQKRLRKHERKTGYFVSRIATWSLGKDRFPRSSIKWACHRKSRTSAMVMLMNALSFADRIHRVPSGAPSFFVNHGCAISAEVCRKIDRKAAVRPGAPSEKVCVITLNRPS